MNYKMNRLLKSMLITCITIGFSVNNLSAQEAWEELAEQLIDEEGGEVFQWENNFEELSELRENPININTCFKVGLYSSFSVCLKQINGCKQRIVCLLISSIIHNLFSDKD